MTSFTHFVAQQVVRHATYSHHQITPAHQQFPALTPQLHAEWRTWLDDTRPLLINGLSDWVASWFEPTPVTPPQAGGSPDQPRRRNSKQLLPSDLERMLRNSSRYVCHRTDREDVGTCETSLCAETDQARKKNPTAPHGVFAAIGVEGIKDYGPYGIVFDRYGRRSWVVVDAPAVLCAVDELTTDEAVGW
ncbi:hypothetical protein ACFV4N_24055 [Actinosynnema sp. NPDC059797]